LNYRLGNRSVIGGWEKSDWQPFWSWVVAGLAAGFFWEFFNFWAGSKWEYHLPYLDFGRVFEMPVFGYSGFLPFALEIFAFAEIFLWGVRKWEKKSLPVRVVIVIGLIAFCLGVFALIDRFTLRG
jgi:hypothetical protein